MFCYSLQIFFWFPHDSMQLLEQVEIIYYVFYWYDALLLFRFLSNQENLYTIHHDLNLFYDIYNTLNEHNWRFVIFLILLSLITLFSFSSKKMFLMSLIVVSVISFFTFSNLKRFLTSLIIFLLQALEFSSLYVYKKINYVFKIWKSVTLLKKRFKVLIILNNKEILWITKIMIKINCSIFMFSNNFIKIIKKDFEKISCKILKSFWRRKRKKVTIWLWTIQKSTKIWKGKACWV